MLFAGYALVIGSAVVLALLAIQQYLKQRNILKLGFKLSALTLYLTVVFLVLGLPGAVVAKGPEENQKFLAAVAALYIAIITGMAAEFFYSWFDKPQRRRRGKIDWGSAIKPLCISPIVLIPTVAAFQNAQIDVMQLGIPSLLILLTAFEKGFLWRRVFAKSSSDSLSKDKAEKVGA